MTINPPHLFPRTLLAPMLALLLAPHAAAQVDVRTIVLSGDPAPGTGGAVFGSLVRDPLINDRGDIVFLSFLEHGPGGVDASNDIGLWIQSENTLRLIAREGDPVPGIDNAFYERFFASEIGLNGDGTVVFGCNYNPDATREAVMMDRAGVVNAIAHTLQPTPEPTSATYSTFAAPRSNEGADVAFNSSYQVGATPIGDQLWLVSEGNFELIAGEFHVAPGAGGARFDHLSGAQINLAGDIVFASSLSGDGIDTTNQNGVWSRTDSGTELLVQSGDAAPGTGGARFESFGAQLNDLGTVLLSGALIHGEHGVDVSNGRGIWSLTDRSFDLLVRHGDVAPGTNGAVFQNLESIDLASGADVIVFRGALDRVNGVDLTNGAGIWMICDGVTELIVRASDQTPDRHGFFTRDLFGATLNTRGDFSFWGRFARHQADSIGAEGVLAEGLWHYEQSSGELVTLVRQGDALDPRGEGSPRTVSEIDAETGGHTGPHGSLNNRNEQVATIRFTDGTSGVFIFTPAHGEPCPGDCDGSGVVDFNDLVTILFEFGDDPFPACDADESGSVDFNDLVSALFLFGECP